MDKFIARKVPNWIYVLVGSTLSLPIVISFFVSDPDPVVTHNLRVALPSVFVPLLVLCLIYMKWLDKIVIDENGIKTQANLFGMDTFAWNEIAIIAYPTANQFAPKDKNAITGFCKGGNTFQVAINPKMSVTAYDVKMEIERFAKTYNPSIKFIDPNGKSVDDLNAILNETSSALTTEEIQESNQKHRKKSRTLSILVYIIVGISILSSIGDFAQKFNDKSDSNYESDYQYVAPDNDDNNGFSTAPAELEKILADFKKITSGMKIADINSALGFKGKEIYENGYEWEYENYYTIGVDFIDGEIMQKSLNIGSYSDFADVGTNLSQSKKITTEIKNGKKYTYDELVNIFGEKHIVIEYNFMRSETRFLWVDKNGEFVSALINSNRMCEHLYSSLD